MYTAVKAVPLQSLAVSAAMERVPSYIQTEFNGLKINTDLRE